MVCFRSCAWLFLLMSVLVLLIQLRVLQFPNAPLPGTGAIRRRVRYPVVGIKWCLPLLLFILFSVLASQKSLLMRGSHPPTLMTLATLATLQCPQLLRLVTFVQ
jgi:hypothetical protein